MVPVVELKESGFLSNPRRRMINTRDGVMSGLENSRKRGKWTKIFDDKSMKTKSILAKRIPRMKKLTCKNHVFLHLFKTRTIYFNVLVFWGAKNTTSAQG